MSAQTVKISLLTLAQLAGAIMLRFVTNDEKVRQQAWNMFNLRGSVFF